MVDGPTFREMALALQATVELPHFEKTSFRVRDKIFATLNETKLTACVKLSLHDQQTFCSIDKALYPVDNSWGKKGWTNINLRTTREGLVIEALQAAYREVLSPINPQKRKQ